MWCRVCGSDGVGIDARGAGDRGDEREGKGRASAPSARSRRPSPPTQVASRESSTRRSERERLLHLHSMARSEGLTAVVVARQLRVLPRRRLRLRRDRRPLRLGVFAPEPLLELEPEVLSSRPLIFRLPQLPQRRRVRRADLARKTTARHLAHRRGRDVAVVARRLAQLEHGDADGGAHPLVARLRRRLSVAARLQPSHAEPLQLARYRPGEQYGLHLDVDPARRGAAVRDDARLPQRRLRRRPHRLPARRPRRRRHAQAAAEARGGGRRRAALARARPRARVLRERFRLARVPRRGDALLFFTLGRDATVDWDLAHGGCPPTSGAKWVAQQWWTLDPAQAQPPEDGAAPLPGGQGRRGAGAARERARARADARGDARRRIIHARLWSGLSLTTPAPSNSCPRRRPPSPRAG